jgi:hypothetical protein
MNVAALIASLDNFSQILPALLAHVSDEQARWKPPQGNWSILEILCHLADEEVEDFRQRLKLVLTDAAAPWPSIRPEEAARDRSYNRQDVRVALDRFSRERADSLEWLRGLDKPDWNAVHEHPQFGPLRAGDLLGAWAAHDWLHLRQMAKRRFELVQSDSQPFQTKYAGTWTA